MVYLNKIQCIIFCLLVILILALSGLPAASAFQVGVSPLILDLGKVQPGESKRASFTITTINDEEFLVYLKASKGTTDFFSGRFSDRLPYYSEEDASKWINFINNPAYLDTAPENKGFGVKKAEQINFILNIPSDAEPGYHLVEITPDPKVPSGQSSTVSIVGITKINMIFKVAGEAVRSGDILDVTARAAGKKTQVDVHFLNTGSVSIYAKALKVLFRDEEGINRGGTESTTGLVKPGEVGKLTGFVIGGVEPGSYSAFANVSYTTGHVSKETDVWIESAPETVVAREEPVAGGFPLWILIIIILVVAYVIYRYV